MLVVLSQVVSNQNIVIIETSQDREIMRNSDCLFSSWNIDFEIQVFWNAMLHLVVKCS